MSSTRYPLRRLASLLACALVLFGTSGVAVLDAAAHAGSGHDTPSHERGGLAPECVLCVAATAPALPAAVPAAVADRVAEHASAVVAMATEAPRSRVQRLAPPGRGPPIS